MFCKLKKASMFSLVTVACGIGIYLLVNAMSNEEEAIYVIDTKEESD